MSKRITLQARVAALFVAAVLLASCYAPIANQKGYLNLGLESSKFSPLTGNQVVVLVIDADFQAALAETLSLMSKGHGPGLSGSETDRLTALAKQIATNGLVNFGGYPFYQTSMNTPTGSFTIPGVPAGRSYFVKLFVLGPNISFDVKNLDQHFFTNLLLTENLVFNTESYLTPWQNWVPNAAENQPVAVKGGEFATINVSLIPHASLP